MDYYFLKYCTLSEDVVEYVSDVMRVIKKNIYRTVTLLCRLVFFLERLISSRSFPGCTRGP